jgi:hypothetical protein
MRRAMATVAGSSSGSGPSTSIRLSRRLDRFGAETVWQEFTPLAREMGAVNLGQGFPDWPTPAFVKEAMQRTQDEDQNQYCRSAGHPPLVQALAAKCVLRARPRTARAKGASLNPLPSPLLPSPFSPLCRKVHCRLWAARQLGD